MYIIAEIGINHNGDLALAKLMIEEAARCGADAVKFQLYDSDKLLEPELAARVRHCDLTEVRWHDLVKYAENIVKIPISASVFDLKRLGWLKNMNPPWYKIASRAFLDWQFSILILNEAAVEKKDVFISLGMYQKGRECYQRRQNYFEYPNAKFLYCKSEYPAQINGDDLELWYSMPEENVLFDNKFVGLSDHTRGIGASLWAIAHGAKVIEKHFTLDRNQPGVDQAASIEPGELKLLCELAPEIERIANL